MIPTPTHAGPEAKCPAQGTQGIHPDLLFYWGSTERMNVAQSWVFATALETQEREVRHGRECSAAGRPSN
jgi:hypothetical protein